MVEQFKQIKASEGKSITQLRQDTLSILMDMLDIITDKAPESEAAKLQVKDMRDFEREFSRACLQDLIGHIDLYEFDANHEYYMWDTINGHGKLISLSQYDYEEILLANMGTIVKDYIALGGE